MNRAVFLCGQRWAGHLALLLGLATVAPGATVYWVGGSGNVWDTSTTNTVWYTGTVPPQPAAGNTYYTAGDTVIFYRDVLTANKTFTVQAGGVSPASFRIDTNGTWNISGGLINAPMTYFDSSGGVSAVNFNGYTTSLGFTTMTIKAFAANVNYNYAGAPGSVRMTSGGITIEPSTATGGGIKFAPTSATTGTYTLTDNLTLNNLHSNIIRAGGGGTGKLIVFSGNVAVNQNLLCTSDTGTADMYFTGTLTLSGARTINQDMNNGGAYGQVHFEDATFAGGAGTSLTFQTTNAGVRRYSLPSTGTRLNVGSLTVKDATVYVNPTSAGEDYFATLRSNGGGVTLDGYGTYGNFLYLQRGAFRSSDFTQVGAARLILDYRTANENLTLAGSGGTGPFRIGGAGNGLTAARVLMDANGGNGTGTLTGDIEVGSGGRFTLETPATTGDTFSLTGNVRLTGGGTLERAPRGRTTRLLVSGGNTLHLGDGNAATAETVTLLGGLIDSGGPNEAWGCNATNVSDDGSVVLRYEMGPHTAWQGEALNKYAVDWRDSSGTVLAFRGGSAGTVFAPDPLLTANGGFVVRGPAAGNVFTATSPTTVETAGLVTFSTNLNNQGVLPITGPVLVTGAGATLDLAAAGSTVRASQITLQSGGRLGGIGTVDAPVVAAAGGGLAPGNSPGALILNQTMTFQSGSVLQWEMQHVWGAAYDSVTVNGAGNSLVFPPTP